MAELRWLLWPPVLFLAVMLAIPLIVLLQQALSGDDAFGYAFSSAVFRSAVWRTLVLATITTVATVVIGSVYALGVALAPAWFKAVLMGGLMLSLWTSVMVRTFGWMLMELPTGAIYWAITKLGIGIEPLDIYQTTVAMYPAMIAVMLPFAVLPVLGAVNALDREQLNASAILGAGPLLTFRAVIAPALAPALISAAVLVFVMSLGFYVTPMLLGGPTTMTVSGIINTQLNTVGRDDVGAAMSILLIGATVGIYLVSDRLFRVSERWG